MRVRVGGPAYRRIVKEIYPVIWIIRRKEKGLASWEVLFPPRKSFLSKCLDKSQDVWIIFFIFY